MRNLFLFLILFSAASPLAAQYRYYRGNTHTHTYPQSDADADFTPQKAVDAYKIRGYDFIVVTEHVAWWNAGVYSTPGMLVINGEEVGISGFGRWGHFTALNIKTRVTGKDRTHQSTIDTIRKVGAVPFLNHPAYSQIPITARHVIDSMKYNLKHIEVYNGVTAAEAGTKDIAVWDSVLSTGRLLYGVAADDAHRESHVGKGWIMVRATTLHPDTITQAVENGDFYPTTGIVIDSVASSPAAVYVRSTNGTRIQFIGKNGAVLATVDSAAATYHIRGDEVYVRAEISNASSQKGWIQPMMLGKPTGVIYPLRETEHSSAPSFTLCDNYPNPFNPATTIDYRLPAVNMVRLAVYDVNGREVAVLVDGLKPAGRHNATFSAHGLASGVYVARFTAAPQDGSTIFSQTMKLLLTK
ncbi:MAG: CehA/McbA family metallohydrolase [Ignavibacteriales bacterium]|nr:CehA/McbA family metallohydrolase [Ignavibacteriales bacterium]